MLADPPPTAPPPPPARVPTYTPLVASSFPPSSSSSSLIPIRLDTDLGDLRIIDSFLLDPQDTSLTPEAMARRLCADLELPGGGGEGVSHEVERRVASSIR